MTAPKETSAMLNSLHDVDDVALTQAAEAAAEAVKDE